MAHWMRFEDAGLPGFGELRDGLISIHDGDLFASPVPTGATVRLDAVRVLPPSQPSKMVCLWNNSRALAAKLEIGVPTEALFFLKASTAFAASGDAIRTPGSYSGKVAFEGELGIVIGKRCHGVAEADAARFIFGYTCVNDVTAVEIVNRDSAFAQWARAKSFDTFGPFGPVIATDLDPASLTVRTILNGKERQSYPVSDMVFSPSALVSLISQDLTLLPGDVIACGTGPGVGSMRPGDVVEVEIAGIGTLVNHVE